MKTALIASIALNVVLGIVLALVLSAGDSAPDRSRTALIRARVRYLVEECGMTPDGAEKQARAEYDAP